MNAVFYGRVRFLSRAAPFDCGLANWSCMSRSVKDDMFICHVCFASRLSGLLYSRFSSFKKIILPGFAYPYKT